MSGKLRVGLVGYGKAGEAVANVLSSDPRFSLRWIARRSVSDGRQKHLGTDVPVIGLDRHPFAALRPHPPPPRTPRNVHGQQAEAFAILEQWGCFRGRRTPPDADD